jgi:hypothetical protein
MEVMKFKKEETDFESNHVIIVEISLISCFLFLNVIICVLCLIFFYLLLRISNFHSLTSLRIFLFSVSSMCPICLVN